MSPLADPRRNQNARRATIPPALAEKLIDRAREHGRSLTEEVLALVNAALAEEARPPRAPDGPYERRIVELMTADPLLTRRMAARIARQGGHAD